MPVRRSGVSAIAVEAFMNNVGYSSTANKIAPPANHAM